MKPLWEKYTKLGEVVSRRYDEWKVSLIAKLKRIETFEQYVTYNKLQIQKHYLTTCHLPPPHPQCPRLPALNRELGRPTDGSHLQSVPHPSRSSMSLFISISSPCPASASNPSHWNPQDTRSQHCCFLSPTSHSVWPLWQLGTLKLDGVGPVDNRPSTDKLNHFVQKKRKEKNYMYHLTRDTWHLTPDTWHLTPDMWHLVGGEHSVKISAP